MVDATAILDQVRAPTLIVHAREDEITPISEGRLVAAGIRGAEFVELDSRNHILLEQEPAWDRFRQVVLDFLHVKGTEGEDPAFGALSTRERQILALIVDGLSNADIADRLGISEKTVRNHTSNLFDKLGVWTRLELALYVAAHGGQRWAARLPASPADALGAAAGT